jgi:GNAT superfamily N-acetyltransferase
MTWRLERKTFQAGKKSGNKRALKKLVEGGARPGVVAYHGREPVAWCALAPRGEYSYLARSRVLAPVDDRAVWSVTCFFVAKPFRGRGVSVRLLRAAAEMAIARGANVVEGYPQVPYQAKAPDTFMWTGLPSAFEKAGFVEVARRSKSRPIMRFVSS